MELGAPAFQPLSQAEMKTHSSSSASFRASSNGSGPARASACPLPVSGRQYLLQRMGASQEGLIGFRLRNLLARVLHLHLKEEGMLRIWR